MDGNTCKTSRVRSRNYGVSEINLITELVEQNIEIINSKLCNNVTNDKKKAVWSMITEKVNRLGLGMRTTREIKMKWSNMHQYAKKEYSAQQLSRRKTSGGPYRRPGGMTESTDKIISLFSTCPSFTGQTDVQSDLQAPVRRSVLHLPAGNESVKGDIDFLAGDGSPNAFNKLTKALMESPLGSFPATATDLSTTTATAPDTATDLGTTSASGLGTTTATDLGTDTALGTATTTAHTTATTPSCSGDSTSPTNATPTAASAPSESANNSKMLRAKPHKIKAEDLTRIQFEVFEEQKIYYQLMNKKLRLELEKLE